MGSKSELKNLLSLNNLGQCQRDFLNEMDYTQGSKKKVYGGRADTRFSNH